MTHEPSIHGRFLRLVDGRSIYLLVSLLALVAIGPWLTENVAGRGLWELLFTLVTLSSIHMVRVKRGEAVISGLLALPTLVSLWLRQVVPALGLTQVWSAPRSSAQAGSSSYLFARTDSNPIFGGYSDSGPPGDRTS
jgi:hypothetical protein